MRAVFRLDVDCPGATQLNPSAPAKFAFGVILMGSGFLVMAAAAAIVAQGSKVLPYWLLMTYLLHTFGELCLSPVGLSYYTKLAPKRFVGQMMGMWFLATSLGNLVAGLIARRIRCQQHCRHAGAIHAHRLFHYRHGRDFVGDQQTGEKTHGERAVRAPLRLSLKGASKYRHQSRLTITSNLPLGPMNHEPTMLTRLTTTAVQKRPKSGNVHARQIHATSPPCRH